MPLISSKSKDGLTMTIAIEWEKRPSLVLELGSRFYNSICNSGSDSTSAETHFKNSAEHTKRPGLTQGRG
jgi:hypothetical protein